MSDGSPLHSVEVYEMGWCDYHGVTICRVEDGVCRCIVCGVVS